MSFGVAVLVVGVVARLTRLVVLDALTETFMVKTINRLGRWPRFQEWFTDLVTCSWCTSMWIAPPVAAAGWYWGHSPWFVIPAVALTASHAISVVAQWADPGRRGFARD